MLMLRHLKRVNTSLLLFPIIALATTSSILSASSLDQITLPPGRTPAISLGPTELPAEEVGIGKLIADRQLNLIGGATEGLHDAGGLLGTVVIVRDPECPVSHRYGPRIAQIARHYQDKGFQFVFIYPSETLSSEQRKQDQQRMQTSGLYVEKSSFALADELGVKSTGDVFILDRQHRLRYRGAIDDQFGLGFTKDAPTRHYLRNALNALYRDQVISTPATTAPGCYIDADPDKDRLFENLPAGQMLS